MKGVIIKSPYIEDILNGVKKIEVRGQNTAYRGCIVLLQSNTNLALGVVDIVDSRQMSLEEYNSWEYRINNGKEIVSKLPYDKTYQWILENPKWFNSPKNYFHPKGAIVWVNLPEDFLNGVD